MKNKLYLLVIVAVLIAVCGVHTDAQVQTQRSQQPFFQWEMPAEGIVSTENGAAPVGYLWIAPEVEQVRSLMFAFQNMSEETLFKMDCFRKEMARLGVALLWIVPGFGQEWDVNQGIQEPFDNLIKSLALESGHPELSHVPLIPFGHSAQATMPWNFAAWNPNRTLCILSYHGDAPRTNLCGYGRSNVEWGRTRNIDGIPGLMVEGEYEWWEARINPALAFRMMYPESCISFLGDAGRGHFDLCETTALYMAKFIEKSMLHRLSSDKLVKVDPTSGWFAARWHPGDTIRPVAAPVQAYKGCPHEAFWYFDEEMALLTEQRYAETEGKQISYIGFQDGQQQLLSYNPNAHCKYTMTVHPDEKDEFELFPVFTDSTRTQCLSVRQTPVSVKYVSGPAISLGNNRFRVDREHPTWKNPRRRACVTLCAEAPGDPHYKETVQEIEVIIQ